MTRYRWHVGWTIAGALFALWYVLWAFSVHWAFGLTAAWLCYEIEKGGRTPPPPNP